MLRGKTSHTFLYAGSEKINWSGRYLSPNAKKYSSLYNPQPLQTFQSLYQNWQGSQRLEVRSCGPNPNLKSGDRKNPANYRPISILPVISKILERHILSVMTTHLNTNSPLSFQQWGFTAGKSTTAALLSFSHDCLESLDGGKEMCSVSLTSVRPSTQSPTTHCYTS